MRAQKYTEITALYHISQEQGERGAESPQIKECQSQTVSYFLSIEEFWFSCILYTPLSILRLSSATVTSEHV